MDFTLILFYAFGALLLGSALLVVLVRNPVHSALFLVLAFVTAAGLWLLLYAEFLAITLVLVYVGAVMVLFLFVVMLVNPRTVRTDKTFQHQWDVALLLFPILLIPFVYVLWTDKLPDLPVNPAAFQTVRGKLAGNTEAVAWSLFRDYLLPFEIASLLLLVAVVGSVVMAKKRI